MIRLAPLLLLAAGILVPSVGLSQDKKEDKKDPQSAIEPKSKSGVGQKFLERFVGDWDVAKTFHPRGGPAGHPKGVVSTVRDSRGPLPPVRVYLRDGRRREIDRHGLAGL